MEKQVHLLCFGCGRRITFNVTCNVTALILLCSAKFQHCEHSNYFVILQKVGPRFNCRGQYALFLTAVVLYTMLSFKWPSLGRKRVWTVSCFVSARYWKCFLATTRVLAPPPLPLWGDKVSMLTHIHPHNKPLRKIQVTMILIYWFASLLKVWSYMTPNALAETRCH